MTRENRSAKGKLTRNPVPPAPKAAVPKAAVPKAAVPKAAVPKAAVPKAAVPKAAAPDVAGKKAAPIRHETDEPDVPPTPANAGRTVARRQRLSDVISNSDHRNLASAWDSANAAEDFVPLPSGEYEAHITEGKLHRSNKRTPGYKLTFEVANGTHVGRRFWHDIWLTAPAVSMAKRDLAKLGIPVEDFNVMRDCLERPLPEGVRCRVRLTVRTDDDGRQFNRVQRFDVIGIDGPNVDAFAPETTELDGDVESEVEEVDDQEPEVEEVDDQEPEVEEVDDQEPDVEEVDVQEPEVEEVDEE